MDWPNSLKEVSGKIRILKYPAELQKEAKVFGSARITIYDAVDLYVELDVPQRHGKVNTMNKFDAQFFGIHQKQADQLDPLLRNLLHVVYEAIADAGQFTNGKARANLLAYVRLSLAITISNTYTANFHSKFVTLNSMLSNNVELASRYCMSSIQKSYICENFMCMGMLAQAHMHLGA